MALLPFKATILIILGALSTTGFLQVETGRETLAGLSPVPSIPLQSDDGLDPINLIFTGYAPSWWVSSNMAGWSDSAYCSGSKTVDGKPYNSTLEHPDPTGLPCYGPRDHIRVWDMGYSPIFGEWSVASTHHEHTVCDPLCHHVIDSWVRPEADAKSSFLGGQAALSISTYMLANAGYYQGVFNYGNATMVELKPPSGHYPVVFGETGLGNQTSWSVLLNGLSATSPRPYIVFDEPNGTYDFTVGVPSPFNASPSSGMIVVNGASISESIQFRTPWRTYAADIDVNGQTVSIDFNGNATVATSTVHATVRGDTTISFNATEVGAIGALNLTFPKSIVPREASTLVYVDGIASGDWKLTGNGSNDYLFFLMPYGTHSFLLRFAQPATPYLEYFAAGFLAAGGVLSALFLRPRLRLRRAATISQLLLADLASRNAFG